jgi:hypothetical protein
MSNDKYIYSHETKSLKQWIEPPKSENYRYVSGGFRTGDPSQPGIQEHTNPEWDEYYLKQQFLPTIQAEGLNLDKDCELVENKDFWLQLGFKIGDKVICTFNDSGHKFWFSHRDEIATISDIRYSKNAPAEIFLPEKNSWFYGNDFILDSTKLAPQLIALPIQQPTSPIHSVDTPSQSDTKQVQYENGEWAREYEEIPKNTSQQQQVSEEDWKDQFEYWLTNNMYINKSTAELIVRHVNHYYNPSPTIKEQYDLRAELIKLRQSNESIKRLLYDLTPGGSEFYNDPEYCASTIREMREANHYTLSGIIKEQKQENERLKRLINENRNMVFDDEAWEQFKSENNL